MRLLTVLLLVVLAMTSVIGAQDNGLNGLTFIDAMPLAEYMEWVGNPATNLYYPVLSPDGTLMAYGGDAEDGTPLLCIHDFDWEETGCTPRPESLISLRTGLEWSQDGRYLATHPDAALAGRESDIWLFDRASVEWANMTDDGVDIDNRYEVEAGATLTDVVPRFHPVTNDLYFVRSVDEDIRTLTNPVDSINTIMRIPATNGELTPGTPAEVVADISELSDELIPVYNIVDRALDGAMSFSPDGTTLAFMFVPRSAFEVITLFTLDTTTGEITELPPYPLITMNGKADWMLEDRRTFEREQVNAVTWAANGRDLLLSTYNYVFGDVSPTTNIYRYDTETGEVTPYLDFSAVPSRAAFTVSGLREGNDHPTLLDVPFAPAYSAFADLIIHVAAPDIIGVSGFVALDAVPDYAPQLIVEADANTIDIRQTYPSVGEDTRFDIDIIRVLSGGYLLTFEARPIR